MSATLGRITIFPIKSLDGVAVDDALVLDGEALADDRRYALVDAEGRFVNGKRTAAVQGIRAKFDLSARTVRLRVATADDAEVQFSLTNDKPQLGEWFSHLLNVACNFIENSTSGFPDDTDSPGPTLVSTATLQTVASWFTGLTLDEVRRRFRANLEIDGVEPFWEDRLAGPHGSVVPFTIGDVRWLGVNPCQRCVVPTRDSASGDVTLLFQKSFAANREQTLPAWATPERFDHYYRLAVNTRLASGQSANRFRVGDAVRIG